MDHKQFDDIIRKKLEGFQPDFDPTHWEQFEEQLSAQDVGQPDVENKMVDATLFDKLHRLEVPYQPEHWTLMADRIGLEFHLRGKIIRYKLLELSLMILLLFTLYNTLPLSGIPSERSPDNATTEQPLRQGAPVAAHIDPQNTTLENSETETADTTIPNNSNQQSTFTGAAPPPEPPSANASISTIGDSERNGAPVSVLSPTTITSPTLSAIALQETGSGWTFQPALPALRVTLPPTAFNSPAVDVRSLKVIGSDDYPLLLETSDLTEAHRRGIRIGMFASSDYNEIFTASNESAFEDFSRYGLGYGGGISVGIQLGRWEIETGAMYSAKQYAPWILQVQGDFKEGYSGTGLKNTELNLVSIPLNVRYDLFRPGSWRFYAMAGANLHVTFQANYYTGDAADLYNKSIPVPPSAPGSSNQPSKFDQENLSRGWFEGGRFDENIYLSGSVGLGVERYLTKEWSIFAQPTYFHSINYFRHGIGPNRDRFNTYSLLMGIKVKL